MDELSFKFIYNGKDSLTNLIRNIQKNYMLLYSRIESNKQWKCWIKMDNEKFNILSKLYFTRVISFIRNFLENRENVSVEIYLTSSSS